MSIYDLFNNLDVNKLDEYIANNQEENLLLEFKEISDAGFTSRDNRKNFAKALSGFANSSGGIVIWGIKATKNNAGIDCACGKNEIKPLSLFMSKLNEYTGSFVAPIVEGECNIRK